MADQEKFVENDKKLSISVLSGAAFCRRRFKKCLKILQKALQNEKRRCQSACTFFVLSLKLNQRSLDGRR
jgi:hypothetical protein